MAEATPSATPNQPAAAPAAAASPSPVSAAAVVEPTAARPAESQKPAEPAKPAAAVEPAKAVPAAEAKPALGDPAKPAEPAKPAQSPAAAAPVEPVYEIKAPDGVTIDPEFIPALAPALKKAGVTSEQLQTIAEAYIQHQVGAPQRMLAHDLEITAKDPDIGGLRYGQTLREVNLALDAFADPDFKKFVQTAGIANRLAFVRVFQRIGEALERAGDRPERSSPDAVGETSRAQRMYGGKPKT